MMGAEKRRCAQPGCILEVATDEEAREEKLHNLPLFGGTAMDRGIREVNRQYHGVGDPDA